MDSNEEPKHIFDLPSCILGLMLWASRVLVCIKLWHCDISIIKMSLMIILYFIMENLVEKKLLEEIYGNAKGKEIQYILL